MAVERESGDADSVIDRVMGKGIVVEPWARVVLNLTELLRRSLSMDSAEEAQGGAFDSLPPDKTGRDLIKLEAKILVIALTELLEQLLVQQPDEESSRSAAQLYDLDAVFREIDAKIAEVAAALGLKAEDLIHLEIGALSTLVRRKIAGAS